MVVVVNFLNRQNQADLRVFELLSSKFRLFDGVFGASDEVLGALESGVDLERRIAEVYQKCRTPSEIEAAFDRLQIELEDQIQARMLETRSTLLENFDAEVAAKLHVRRDKALESLGHRRSLLLKMTRTELASRATFHDDEPRFEVPEGEFRGHYHLLWPKAEASGATFFREDHPLALSLMEKILERTVPPAVLIVDSAGHNVASISPFRGSSGVVYVAKLRVDSFDTEEFLLLSGKTEDGRGLDSEQCDHLLNLPARLDPTATAEPFQNWEEVFQPMVQQKLNEVEVRNTKYFDEEADKLDNWSEDLKQSLEKGLKEIEIQIKEAKALKRAASNLHEKLAAVQALNKCEAQRKDMRRDLYTQQDEVVKKRDALIDEIAAQLKSRSSLSPVFALPWRLI
jgi:adenine-specific DNA-methyltransferase